MEELIKGIEAGMFLATPFAPFIQLGSILTNQQIQTSKPSNVLYTPTSSITISSTSTNPQQASQEVQKALEQLQQKQQPTQQQDLVKQLLETPFPTGILATNPITLPYFFISGKTFDTAEDIAKKLNQIATSTGEVVKTSVNDVIQTASNIANATGQTIDNVLDAMKKVLEAPIGELGNIYKGIKETFAWLLPVLVIGILIIIGLFAFGVGKGLVS